MTNLIDKDTRWWNVPLIKEAFEEEEVAAICQIPISSYNGRDQQIWRCTKNGEFKCLSFRNGDRCEW